MIAPGAIFFHASYVISPGGISMDKVEKICSIGLCEEKHLLDAIIRAGWQYNTLITLAYIIATM